MNSACIILNRNVKKPTEKLYKYFKSLNFDTFVIEAGSDKKNIGNYKYWHLKSKTVKKKGLRFCQGFNYGLWKLYKEDKLKKYDLIYLVTNDVVIKNKFNPRKINDTFKKIPRLSILTPCSKDWPEYDIIKKNGLKFYWYLHNTTLILRKNFILDLCNFNKNSYKNFLYDGDNFRGYFADIELVMKGYINNWASGITNELLIEENEDILKNNFKRIKTDSYEKNLKIYLSTGKFWMKKKYGFKNKWQFQKNCKFWYDHFFRFNYEYKKYKLA